MEDTQTSKQNVNFLTLAFMTWKIKIIPAFSATEESLKLSLSLIGPVTQESKTKFIHTSSQKMGFLELGDAATTHRARWYITAAGKLTANMQASQAHTSASQSQ